MAFSDRCSTVESPELARRIGHLLFLKVPFVRRDDASVLEILCFLFQRFKTRIVMEILYHACQT